jgi:hypothetical protein
MKSYLPTVALLIFLAAGKTPAQAPSFHYGQISTEFTVRPTIGYLSGYTSYVLDVGVGVDRLRSELEFPLSGIYVGGEVEFCILLDGKANWRFSMGLRFAPGDPHGTMYDTDWGYLGSGTFGIWSYTESVPAGHSFAYTLSCYRTIQRGLSWSLALVAGLNYFRHVQTIDNFAGWQIVDANLTVQEFSVVNEPALDYRVSYLAPEIGLAGNFNLSAAISTDMQLQYGRVRATDKDDHLLRKKISEGSGWGDQVHASLSGQIQVPGQFLKRQAFLGFQFSFATLRVKGTQYQQFYEEVTETDPISGEPYTIPKGTRIDDLPHDFHSTRYEIGLRAGLTL